MQYILNIYSMTAEKKLAKDLSRLFCKEDAQVSQVVLVVTNPPANAGDARDLV